jgi:hypothetical protein
MACAACSAKNTPSGKTHTDLAADLNLVSRPIILFGLGLAGILLLVYRSRKLPGVRPFRGLHGVSDGQDATEAMDLAQAAIHAAVGCRRGSIDAIRFAERELEKANIATAETDLDVLKDLQRRLSSLTQEAALAKDRLSSCIIKE